MELNAFVHILSIEIWYINFIGSLYIKTDIIIY